MNLRPFRIAVPDADIADLHARLDRTRWPDEINDGDWGWGTPLPWLKGLAEYWRHGFDWRAQEARLNTLPQFMATIDGQDIHFVHLRSPKSPGAKNALPLVLTHGWPGSFVEFEAIAPMLTGDFDLVCNGHEHRAVIERVCNIRGGETLRIDPGSVAGVSAATTYVFGDLQTLEFEIRTVPGYEKIK